MSVQTMNALAIRGGKPLRSKPWPLWPNYKEADYERLRQVLESRAWGGIPFPNRFASEFIESFTQRLGAKHGVLVANGTASLAIALRAMGIRAGDEVITTGYTWVGTAGAILQVNAVPVIVDISPDSYCIDPQQVENAITPRTKAIIPVHLGNQMADMDRIMEIAARHQLKVLEDCAHAHFAEWRGRPAGTLGNMGSYSFESSKIMTSGEGGFLATNDTALWSRAMSLTNCGRKEPPYDHFEDRSLGWNYRVTDFQAAILIGQLEIHDELYQQRSRNAKKLAKGLQDIGGFEPLPEDERVTRRQYYEVIFRYHPEQMRGVPRDTFLKALLAEGVEFEGDTFYPPMNRDPLFAVTADEFPSIRERYGDRIRPESFSLPVAERAAFHESVWVHHSLISGPSEDIDDILDAVAKIKEHLDELGEDL
jgi:dTDP-4-amino-4,6-dideoxygalactose transaminase